MDYNLWSLDDIHCELEIVRDKMNDLRTILTWQGDVKFKFDYIKSNSELVQYGIGYDEHRIQHDQLIDLLRTYNQLLEEAMDKLTKHLKKDDETE